MSETKNKKVTKKMIERITAVQIAGALRRIVSGAESSIYLLNGSKRAKVSEDLNNLFDQIGQMADEIEQEHDFCGEAAEVFFKFRPHDFVIDNRELYNSNTPTKILGRKYASNEES